MKKYTTDMIKLLSLLLVTPILVMAYTKIEKTVSPATTQQSKGGMTGVTPVSIGLVDKDNGTDADITKPNYHNDYILVKSPAGDAALSGKDIVQTGTASNRFALVLL